MRNRERSINLSAWIGGICAVIILFLGQVPSAEHWLSIVGIVTTSFVLLMVIIVFFLKWRLTRKKKESNQ